MARYAAFLRGINVGGHRVTAGQFKACFASLGLEDASTFRASGNVVFDSKESSVKKLTALIEEGLESELGYAVPAFLRTGAELGRIAAFEPFGEKVVAASKGKLQIWMLRRAPAAKVRDEILALATDDDRLAIEGRELYWLPSGGTLETGLDLKAIAKALGPTTSRTMGTVQLMAAKYF